MPPNDAPPVWEDTEPVAEETPTWEETSEYRPVPLTAPIAPFQPAATIPGMGPAGPIDTGEGIRSLATLPQSFQQGVIQPLHEALAPEVSDFLARTGIDPSSTPEHLLNFPQVTPQQVAALPPALTGALPGLGPAAALAPGVVAGLVNLGTSTVAGFAQPEQAALLPLLSGESMLAKAANLVLGAQQFAELPAAAQEAYRVMRDPNATTAEKTQALLAPGVEAAFGALMAKQGLMERKPYAQTVRGDQEIGAAPGQVPQGRQAYSSGDLEQTAPGQPQPLEARKETGRTEVLLKPHLDTNQRLGLGYEVTILPDFGPADPNHLRTAVAGPPVVDAQGKFVKPGRIYINQRALYLWLSDIPQAKRAQALKSMMTEEGIHATITDQEALAYAQSLSGVERAIGEKLYRGVMSQAEANLTPAQRAHELLRQRMQRLLRLDPTEIAEVSGRERWTRRSLEMIANILRTIRERIGTKAAKFGKGMTDQLMDRFGRNISAALDNVSEPAAPEPELIKHSFYRDEATGETFIAPNHPEALDYAGVPEDLYQEPESRNGPEFGFITNKGRELTREQAEALGKANGQDLSPFIGASRPKGAMHSNEVLDPETGEPISESGDQPFSLRRRLTGNELEDYKRLLEAKRASVSEQDQAAAEHGRVPQAMAKVIGNVKFDGVMDWKLKGMKPKWQWTLTTPGHETTFYTDADAPFKDVRHKAAVKDFQMEHDLEDYDEAARLLGEQQPEFAQRPAGMRRKKGQAEPEFFLPPVEGATERGVPASISRPEGVQPSLALQEPSPATERPTAATLGARPANAFDLEKAAYGLIQAHTDAMEAQDAKAPGAKTQAPDFEDFSRQLRLTYGQDLPTNAIRELWGKAVWRRIENASGKALSILRNALNLKTKVGTRDIADPPAHVPSFALEGEMGRQAKAAVREARKTQVARQNYRRTVQTAIAQALIDQAQPAGRTVSAEDITPGDIDVGAKSLQPAVNNIGPAERADPKLLAKVLTDDARTMGKNVSNTKRLTVIQNRETGKVAMVSTFRDPRRGAVLLDPDSPGQTHGTLDSVLKRWRPVASILLDSPVKNFLRKYDSLGDYQRDFGQAANARMDDEFRYPAPETEGQAPAPGLLAVRGPLTDTEAGSIMDHLYDEVSKIEGPQDVRDAISALNDAVQRKALTPKDWQTIVGYAKIFDAIQAKNPKLTPDQAFDRLADEISSKAKQAESREAFQENLLADYTTPDDQAVRRLAQRSAPAAAPSTGRPASIRRNVADELLALGHDIKGINLYRVTADKVSSTLDSADALANNYSRQVETGIRIQSLHRPAGWVAAKVRNWRYGNQDVLHAANALVEAGAIDTKYAFDHGKKPVLDDFIQMVNNGLAEARRMMRDPSWRLRRLGRAYERDCLASLQELDYAKAHWDDPELQNTAIRMKRELDQAYAREKKAGQNLARDPNYLPHRYDATLWNGRSVFFSIPRIRGLNYKLNAVFETHYHALEAGPYIRVTHDGASLVAHRVRQGLSAITHRMWEQSLQGIDVEGRPLAVEPKLLANGKWQSPSVDYTLVRTSPGGKPLAVLDEYKRLVKNLTSESFVEDWAPSRNLLHWSQRLKHTLLVGDFFHLSRVLYYGASIMRQHMGFQGGWSVLDIKPQDVGEAVRRGLIRQADADWGSENIPFGNGQVTRRDLATMFYARMGGNLGKIQDALYKELVTNLTPTAGNVARGVVRVIDPTVGRYNRFLFDRLTRGLMAESMVREFERRSKTEKAAPEMLMRDIALDVNRRFGNLGRQGLLKARWQQDLARVLWLAPQWVEGLYTSELTAYSRMSGLSRALGRPKELGRLGTLGSSTAAGMVYLFGLTQAINLISRGHPTFQNKEKGHKLDAWIPGSGGDGQGFFFSPLAIYNELAHDVYRLSHTKHNFMEIADQIEANKESPLYRAWLVLQTRFSPTGEYQTSTASTLGEAGKQFMPLPITFGKYLQSAGHALMPSTIRQAAPGTMERQAFATFGMKVEPALSPSQRMSQLAADFVRKQGLEKDTGWKEIMTSDPSYSKLRASLRANDESGAAKIFNRMAATRDDREIINSMRQWSKRGFAGSQRNESYFINSLTPEELEAYSDAMQNKQMLYEKFLQFYQNLPAKK